MPLTGFTPSEAKSRKQRSSMPLTGFTLIELIFTIAMFVALTGVMAYIFRALLLSWQAQETRLGIGIGIAKGIEEMARELREVKQVTAANDEIRFSPDQSNYYIYYFYNSGDTYPLNFDQSLYQLKRATLSGGIAGSFTYGSGSIVANDILPPSASDLSLSGNVVTLDLSQSVRDETIRLKTMVRPRNL